MTYHNAIKYILCAPDKNGPVASYARIELLSSLLGSPEAHLKYVRFAGSNGKTVCQTMMSRVLTEAGIKVGSLLMPTTKEPRENVLICGEPISFEDTVTYVEAIVRAVNTAKNMVKAKDERLVEELVSEKVSVEPTKNEIILLMALLAFRDKGCAISLIECEQKGADPTKFLAPAPHTVICGTIPDDDTSELRKIKSYIKSGITEIVSAPQDPRAFNSISGVCADIGCRFSMPIPALIKITRLTLKGSEFTYRDKGYKLSLSGRFQIQNATTVIEAAAMLERAGYSIGYDALCRAFSRINLRTKFETLSLMPTIIADSTHQTEAVVTMSKTLTDFKEQTGSDIVLCISHDLPLIEEYLKNFSENGYNVKEIIIPLPDKNTVADTADLVTDAEISMPTTYKAAAKRIISASREHGFVLITGEYEPTDKLRNEVLRILEY